MNNPMEAFYGLSTTFFYLLLARKAFFYCLIIAHKFQKTGTLSFVDKITVVVLILFFPIILYYIALKSS